LCVWKCCDYHTQTHKHVPWLLKQFIKVSWLSSLSLSLSLICVCACVCVQPPILCTSKRYNHPPPRQYHHVFSSPITGLRFLESETHRYISFSRIMATRYYAINNGKILYIYIYIMRAHTYVFIWNYILYILVLYFVNNLNYYDILWFL